MMLRNISKRHGQLARISSSVSSPWFFSSLVASYSDDAPAKKGKVAPLQERRMIDRFTLWAKGGEGGTGCSSMRRTRTDRLGKPDGGNGGKGGDVILECSCDLWDFSGLQHHLNGKRGGNGISKNQIGTRGSDKIVHVPVGTVIHLVTGEPPSLIQTKSTTSLLPWELETQKPVEELETKLDDQLETKLDDQLETKLDDQLETKLDNDEMEGEEQDEIQYSVAELTTPGQRLLIAKGGEGGLGNSSLPKSKAGQSQRSVKSTQGQSGSESVMILELKSIADVGLVGFPNAGKSTLLGAMSRAQPLVGNYDFTTLRPNIGDVGYDDYFRVKIADIPGLIKGASENRGLGHAFLRHVERTRVLVYVLDLAAEMRGRTVISQLKDLVGELERYKKGMSEKPSLVVGNKVDEEGCEKVYEELERRVGGCVGVLRVCAVLGEGVSELKDGIRRVMDGEDCRSVDLSKIDVD